MRLKDNFIFHIFTKITSVFFNCFDALYQLDNIPVKLGESFFSTFYPDMLIINEKNIPQDTTKEVFKQARNNFKPTADSTYIYLPMFRTMEGKEYIYYFFFNPTDENETMIEMLRNGDFQQWLYNISQSLYGLLNFFEQIQNIRLFFDNILNTLPGILVLFTDDENIIEWRDNTSLTGYESKTMHGNQMNALIENMEDIQKVKTILKQKFENGDKLPTIREIEGHIKHKDGTQIISEFDIAYFKDEHDEYFIGVGKDVTEKRELQKQLKKRNEELEQFYKNYSKELKFASILQRKMMKNQTTDFKDIKTTAFYCPFEYVGGDYVGVLPIKDKLLFVVADVVGHGVFAAFYSSMIHSSFHNLIFHPETICNFMERVYKEFANIMEYDNFMSIIVGEIDTKKNKINFFIIFLLNYN